MEQWIPRAYNMKPFIFSFNKNCINPFHANVPFLYLLKMSENLWHWHLHNISEIKNIKCSIILTSVLLLLLLTSFTTVS